LAVALASALLAVASAADAAAASCKAPEVRTGSAAATTSGSNGLKVVSLNMAREAQLEAIRAGLQSLDALAGADVWLLQEAAERSSPEVPTVADLAGALGLHYAFAPADVLDEGRVASGLAILSRYPILEPRVIELSRHELKFNTRCRIALHAQIDTPFGRMSIYNVHLDTRITGQQRLDQMMPVLDAAASWAGPVIVAGDFNTSNLRWLWNVVPMPFGANDSERVRQAFRDRGFSSPLDGGSRTLDVLWLPFRLDWIFPRGLDAVSAGVTEIGFSDHNAVWVQLSDPDSLATGAGIGP
jgi:endonuclease/exonuclease/phosphatase family metal-dependent hydrolase